MKTLQRSDEIIRVSDAVAENLISSNKGWKYTSKETWKTKVRDINNQKDDKSNETKNVNLVETPKRSKLEDTSKNQKPAKKKKHTKTNEK